MRHGKSESGWPDVGFLEVDPKTALPILEKDALSIDRINPSGPGDSGQRCFLYGYPAKMILQRQAGHALYSTFKPVSYSSLPLERNYWPSVSEADPPLDASVDIFMPYDPNDEMCVYKENDGNSASDRTERHKRGRTLAEPSVCQGVWSADNTALIGPFQTRGKRRRSTSEGARSFTGCVWCEIQLYDLMSQQRWSKLSPT